MSTQAQINYVDDAQRRVAADTLCYQKKQEIVVNTTGITDVDPEVIRIEGLYDGTEQLTQTSADDLLSFLSGSQQTARAAKNFTFIGRQLYIWPTPTETLRLVAIYKARPPVAESDQPLTVSGQFEALVDHLAQAMILLDSGQTNVASSNLDDYVTQAARLRRRAGAKPGGSGRVRRLGQRMR